MVKNIISQSTPVTKCTLYLASKNKWMWWWVGGVTATTRMQINLILKDISGRGCRAHADYHSRHYHQQYWQSLLSQYIQVHGHRYLVWKELIILLIRSIKFHIDTEIFKNSKEKAELVRDFLMDSETFDDNSKSKAAAPLAFALSGWNRTLTLLSQFFLGGWKEKGFFPSILTIYLHIYTKYNFKKYYYINLTPHGYST